MKNTEIIIILQKQNSKITHSSKGIKEKEQNETSIISFKIKRNKGKRITQKMIVALNGSKLIVGDKKNINSETVHS
jgi:hypothetical protein